MTMWLSLGEQSSVEGVLVKLYLVQQHPPNNQARGA